MIFLECEQGSKVWHDNRLGRFTGTRFSTLMSGEATKGYKDLISEIACEIATGQADENYVSADMERGKEMEPIARREYSHIMEVEVSQTGMILFDEDHPLHEWVGVSPDGVTGSGILEIKCPKLKTHWGYIMKDRLPNEYKWQVQGLLWVSGMEYVDFMSFYPGIKPFIKRVFPDREMHDQLTERVAGAIPKIISEIEAYEQYEYL